MTYKLNNKLSIIGGLWSILLALPYIFSFFGPTEGEVRLWGEVSLLLGVFLILVSVIPKISLLKFVYTISFLFLGLIQVPPIFLWFMFHGHGITDGTPLATFIAHWMYSIPHISMLIICLFGLFGGSNTLSRYHEKL